MCYVAVGYGPYLSRSICILYNHTHISSHIYIYKKKIIIKTMIIIIKIIMIIIIIIMIMIIII